MNVIKWLITRSGKTKQIYCGKDASTGVYNPITEKLYLLKKSVKLGSVRVLFYEEMEG